MSHRRRIGLSITNSSLIFDKQPSTWSHSTLPEPLKRLYPLKNEEDDAEVRKIENHKTSTKSAWSKAFYRKTEKWRNWINSSKHSIASIILFSLFINRRLFRFSSVKEEKDSFDEWRKTFSLETFFTRPHICNWSWYRIFSPPPAPVHRTTFLG